MKFEEGDKIVYCKDASYLKEANINGYSEFNEKKYYKGYLIHREDGPAIEYINGDKRWYFEGKLHREDEPAAIYNNYKMWYIDGKLHRWNGPAIECNDGGKTWFLFGGLHREDGPAIEYSNGDKYWFLNDKEYSEKKYWKVMNLKNKQRVLDEI